VLTFVAFFSLCVYGIVAYEQQSSSLIKALPPREVISSVLSVVVYVVVPVLVMREVPLRV
jgi:hypothetical protein